VAQDRDKWQDFANDNEAWSSIKGGKLLDSMRNYKFLMKDYACMKDVLTAKRYTKDRFRNGLFFLNYTTTTTPYPGVKAAGT
jgi:hypothetical protein